MAKLEDISFQVIEEFEMRKSDLQEVSYTADEINRQTENIAMA